MNIMSIVIVLLFKFYHPGYTPDLHHIYIDLVRDDTWEHSGEKLTYASGWNANEPNNYKGPQDCAVIKMDGWGDYRCGDNTPFLCEVNIWKWT